MPGTAINVIYELLHLILRATPKLALILYNLQMRRGKVQFATALQQFEVELRLKP